MLVLNLTFFILGIVLYGKINCLIIFSLLPLFFLPKINIRNILCFIFFFLLGWAITGFHNKKPLNLDSSNIYRIEGEVLSIKEKPFLKKIIVKTEKVFIQDNWRNFKIKILIETDKKFKLIEGQRVKIKNIKIEEIPPPKNPYEFNYKKFMEREDIFFKGKADNIEILPSITLNLLISKLREIISRKIEKYMKFNPDGRELVKILLIGEDDIPEFLRETGIKAGIYHLFVISGLHIGFIILIFKILFIPFQRLNNTKPKIFPALLLIFLWFYNFLCGLRIPVMRAVLMVSFYLIFEILERDIEPVNSLVFAAFSILFFNPFTIYSLSFFLSFLSTAGILIFPKRFKIYGRNFFIDLGIISLSAQLLIFPVLFYNFGYFYPAGILNNLIFFPFVGLIIITGFFSLFFPFLFIPLNFLTDIFLKVLSIISNFSPRIEFFFPLISIFLFYFILFILSFSLNPWKKFLFVSLNLILIIFILKFGNFSDKQILFFSSQKPFVLIKNNRKCILITEGKISNPEYYYEILWKMMKREKLRIEKIFVYNKSPFIENLNFLNKFSDKIYVPQNNNISQSQGYKKLSIKEWKNNNFNFGEFKIETKEKNFIVSSQSLSPLNVLILFNIPFPKDYLTYRVIYLAEFKKNKKNEEFIKSLNPAFFILPSKSKKFENLKDMCKNYYLNEKAVLIDFLNPKIDYWQGE